MTPLTASHIAAGTVPCRCGRHVYVFDSRVDYDESDVEWCEAEAALMVKMPV